MFCTNCGEEVKLKEQEFCENCGFKLLQTQKKENSVKTNVPLKRNLFDLNHEYYILKNDYWKTGSGYIFDAQDKSIGLVDSKKKKKIELKEMDNTITATINFKKGSFRGATELKDQDENLIAKLTKKRISDFNAIYFLEGPNGTRWYAATGEFINFKFQIEDLSINKYVAECNKTEKWKEDFSGNLDYKNDYALKILDKETDRRILLLFVIGIRQIRYFRMF
ncbi:MAG: zinc ribbon domain-containing protein [Promethearchaeota archaeon]